MTDFDKVQSFLDFHIDAYGYKPTAMKTAEATGLKFYRVEYIFLRMKQRREKLKKSEWSAASVNPKPYMLIDPEERVRF